METWVFLWVIFCGTKQWSNFKIKKQMWRIHMVVGINNFKEKVLKWCKSTISKLVTCDMSHITHDTWQAEFFVTPKFGVLLRIRSNWAKHSEFTPKFGAPRLGHHLCSLNGWKILSRSWDMSKWRCLQKTLPSRTNFVQNVVQNYRGHNLILNFQVHLETKVQIFKVLELFFLQIIFVGKKCSLKMKRNTKTI